MECYRVNKSEKNVPFSKEKVILFVMMVSQFTSILRVEGRGAHTVISGASSDMYSIMLQEQAVHSATIEIQFESG